MSDMKINPSFSKTAREVMRSIVAIPWQDGHGNLTKYAQFEHKGFSVKVAVEYDFDHDFTDGRGHFTDVYVDGAVENPHYRYERHVFRYFVPDTTIVEHRRGLQELGYSKGVAQEMAEGYVREDALIAADPERAGLSAYRVSAKASLEGVTLGESSCGGVEIARKDEGSYIDEIAWEEVGAALYEAREKLAKLRGEK